jgi:hypothetical protein
MKELSLTVSYALWEFRLMGYSDEKLYALMKPHVGNALLGVNSVLESDGLSTRVCFEFDQHVECDFVRDKNTIGKVLGVDVNSVSALLEIADD